MQQLKQALSQAQPSSLPFLHNLASTPSVLESSPVAVSPVAHVVCVDGCASCIEHTTNVHVQQGTWE